MISFFFRIFQPVFAPEQEIFFEERNKDFYKNSFLKRAFWGLVIISILGSIGLSVFFVHAIVADEYAITSLTTEIKKEEQQYRSILANYAKVQSLIEMSDDRLSSLQFVSVETPRYIGVGGALQANATRK